MKGIHHYQIAAIGGCDTARWNLASFEKEQRGDSERSLKHFMISASAGNGESLGLVKKGFMSGMISKDQFEKTLRANKESTDEMKSPQRDWAAKVRRKMEGESN